MLALSGNTLYFGGDFRLVGDRERLHLAALDTSTGRLTTWNPYLDSSVFALLISEPNIYASGWFEQVGDTTRHHFAAINTETAIASRWYQPSPPRSVGLPPLDVATSLGLGVSMPTSG